MFFISPYKKPYILKKRDIRLLKNIIGYIKLSEENYYKLIKNNKDININIILDNISDLKIKNIISNERHNNTSMDNIHSRELECNWNNSNYHLITYNICDRTLKTIKRKIEIIELYKQKKYNINDLVNYYISKFL